MKVEESCGVTELSCIEHFLQQWNDCSKGNKKFDKLAKVGSIEGQQGDHTLAELGELKRLGK